MHKSPAILLFIILHSFCLAQSPLQNYKQAIQVQFSNSQPVINYTVIVDTSDLHLISVQIDLHNIADTFYLAMFAHPEYDDRYWRFVENLHAETPKGNASVFRKDSAIWRVVTQNNEAIIHYNIRLAKLPGFRGLRSAWRPFLSSGGGLIGDYHTFMYVVGETLVPAHISFRIPMGWKIATGLEPTSDPYNFFAASAGVLMDAPVLIGKFKSWKFTEGDVPHTVAYWAFSNAPSFDSVTFVKGIQKMVKQASALFGQLPYREYFFLIQDGSYGSLEHNNSVTIGLPSQELAENVINPLGEISHEYFHAWNMMRIHPAEYGDISYKQPPLSRGLWWSEGLTMFYSDLLLRRAGIVVDTSSRINHLEQLIERYYNNPGNNKISPEKVSMAANAPPGFLGDYQASTHLQGEIIGDMLDIIIRDATNEKYSIDELMRNMLVHFGGEKGFTGKDVEHLTTSICNCNIHSFFENYIRGNQPIDFNKYLKLIGLQLSMSWTDAMSNDKKLMPDTRIYVWNDRNRNSIMLLLIDPKGCWAKAGLHTGDVIKEVNDTLINSTEDFYRIIKNIQIGNNVKVGVKRGTVIFNTKVIVSGYKQAIVHIISLPKLSARQLKLRTDWLSGI